MRQGLIAMLPRLKRFADTLAGDKDEGRALLRRALIRMLSERRRYQKDVPLDRFAFSEIYRRFRNEHRDDKHAPARAKPTHASFERLFHRHGEDGFDAFTANFLWQLPPQARCALLLVYGEGFGHGEAASVLETTGDAIAARLVRGAASFADRLRASSDAGETGRPDDD